MGATMGNGGDTFDVRRIRRLVDLMREFDLSEVDLKQGDQRIRLRRGRDGEISTVGAPITAAPTPVAASAAPAPPRAAEPSPAAADSQHVFVTSPMVGTFYVAPSPEASPFVKVGDHVGPDSTVCVIEAMKVFNDIPAGVAGKVVAVLVENGASVEFGQRLFRVDPNS